MAGQWAGRQGSWPAASHTHTPVSFSSGGGTGHRGMMGVVRATKEEDVPKTEGASGGGRLVCCFVTPGCCSLAGNFAELTLPFCKFPVKQQRQI